MNARHTTFQEVMAGTVRIDTKERVYPADLPEVDTQLTIMAWPSP